MNKYTSHEILSTLSIYPRHIRVGAGIKELIVKEEVPEYQENV